MLISQKGLIDTLTNLIKTQNECFTNTLNCQHVTINNLQTELDNVKKSHDRRIDMAMTLGDDHFKLLDEKLDKLGDELLIQTKEVMSQAEAHVNEMMMDEKASRKIADKMTEKVFEKNVKLANGKKMKAPLATKDNENQSDDKLLPNQDPVDPEGEARTRETKEEDPETHTLKVDGARADQKQEIIEIEESDTVEADDAMEEDVDDKWAKQETSEDTTVVAVDQFTSSITYTESPTPTTLTSVTSKTPTAKTKQARFNSPPTAPMKAPRDAKITNFFTPEPANKGAGSGSR